MPKSKSSRTDYVMYMKKRIAWYVRMKDSREFVRCEIRSKNPDGTLHINLAKIVGGNFINTYNLWAIGADDVYNQNEVAAILRKEAASEQS